jgi:hypothetical protein
MPIIEPRDLETNIYPEILEEITRANSPITERAIATAISEAKLYLGKYDLLQLFGSNDSPPAIADELLKSLVKDIACWHLLRLANPGADHAAYRTAYNDATTILKNIMNGQAQPEGWPYASPANGELPDGNTISWSSNTKRSNYY